MIFSVLLLYIITTLSHRIHACNNIREWPHKTFLDSKYKIFAKWIYNEQNITIEVIGETKGWLGIGFSPNGGMPGADIALGWVTNGKGFLQDRHGPSNDNGFPSIDKKQDVELLSSSENETHTTLCFRRKFDTCDEKDLPITNGTMKIIWAMHPNDPSDPEIPEYHGPQNRGQLMQNILGKTYEKPEGDDIKSWDIKVNKIPIPGNESTFYWCKIFAGPNVTEKQHLVGYEAIIQKENEDIMHHFGIYECTDKSIVQLVKNISDRNLNDGFPCFEKTSPPAYNYCYKSFVTWAVGLKSVFFPPNVGLPFAFYDNKISYYMIDAHYNNANLSKGRVDSSGLRFYYTNKYRKDEASEFVIGYTLHQPFQIIPPGQQNWRVIAQCAPECLRETFATDKIQLFGAHLHAHKTVIQIVVRHFRGITELPPVLSNKHFNFNFQEVILFPNVEVLPDDILTVECIHNTSEAKKNVLGGITAQDEMCMAFILYYPRMGLNRCYSNILDKFVKKLTGVEELKPIEQPHDEPIIQYPISLQNTTLRSYLKNLTLTKSQISQLRNEEVKGTKAVTCFTDKGQLEDKYVKYPEDFVPYIKKDGCT